MESVRKARQRMQNYPLLLSKCSDKAAIYAACVTRDLNVQHQACSKEFEEFKTCLLQAAKNMKTKL